MPAGDRAPRVLDMSSTVPLPGGVAMPLVGFGTWALRGEHAYRAVRRALDVGYRHLDTATMYGNEAEIGRAVRDSGVPREEVFITTKLMPTDAGRERRVIAASLATCGSSTRRHGGTGSTPGGSSWRYATKAWPGRWG